MTLTLTPEQTRKLQTKAERAHKSMDAVLDDLLDENTVYPVYTPDENYEAVRIMQEVLEEHNLRQESFTENAASDELAHIRPQNRALLALLQKWHEEDEAMTDEEIEQATRDYEELRTNLNLNRIRAGEEPLYS